MHKFNVGDIISSPRFVEYRVVDVNDEEGKYIICDLYDNLNSESYIKYVDSCFWKI